MQTMKFRFYGTEYTLKFMKQNYQITGNTCIEIMCCEQEEDGFWEPFGRLSVNLKNKLEENMIMVDINNCDSGLIAEIEKKRFN